MSVILFPECSQCGCVRHLAERPLVGFFPFSVDPSKKGNFGNLVFQRQ